MKRMHIHSVIANECKARVHKRAYTQTTHGRGIPRQVKLGGVPVSLRCVAARQPVVREKMRGTDGLGHCV